jgi:hypothetical protein
MMARRHKIDCLSQICGDVVESREIPDKMVCGGGGHATALTG